MSQSRGAVLLSHPVTRAGPSAQDSLTSVLGVTLGFVKESRLDIALSSILIT
jgi:hypothetical protein